MSEVASRPSASRGRGSGRGGRGGFAGRGGRRTNSEKLDQKALADDTPGAFDNDGDVAELRKLYGDKTSVIREMFPDWSEVDVLYALQETNGDQADAVTRIAEGTMSQWGEVSKVKKPSTKKETTATLANEPSSSTTRTIRGGRGASEGTRGRGRASDRGGRGGRGRVAQAATNGPRSKENQPLSVATEDVSAWEHVAAQDGADNSNDPASNAAETAQPVTASQKTWASMLRQSTAPKPVPKPKEAPVAKPDESTETEPLTEAHPAEPETQALDTEQEITPVAEHALPVQPPVVIEPEVALPPSKDELTKTNLEQVVDDSQPPATATVASTTADSWDPRQTAHSATATPLSAAHQQHQAARAAPSGFAASATKATADRGAARIPSYQRRVLDQEEAVRMPGNREVDRAAVQFGAFNLNGDDDVDGDREEPETRAQPPADSPISHPRASLPPVSQPASVPEPLQQKPTTTAPPGMTPSDPTTAAAQASLPGQSPQYGRFGHPGPQDGAQKAHDPFAQQATSTQPPFDSFSSQTSQPPAQQAAAAFSSAPSEYSSYYTSQQDRFNYYGSHFGQQGLHGQDALNPQQRGHAGYNSSQNDSLSQYPQSASHNQPRFGAGAGAGAGANDSNSGHSTPNPVSQGQQQQGQHIQQGQQQGAPGSQPQTHGQQYPGGFNHPYYNNPYYQQFYSGYGQGGYPYGKSGMYAQPYGVSPNDPYGHASSPASFGHSSLNRDSGIGSSLDNYGRSGSGQAGSQQGLGGGFGGAHDGFSRGASSFQSQGSFNSQSQQAGGAAGDDLKPFGDSKAGSGPSPSIGGARPGSATNNAPSGQSGLPPPQGSQMGGSYAGYPNHLQGHGIHGGSGYGMGGAGNAGSHGNSPYGSYGQSGFGGSGYYGGQQQQQQRGGWGGNYH